MGCGSSSTDPTRTNNHNRRVAVEHQNKIQQNNNEGDSQICCFDQIVANVKSIAAPSNMMPVVCLSNDAFPVVPSFLHLEDSTPTEIQLPIVAGSICGKGRVICFSQLQFVLDKCINVADTKRLVVNSLNWLTTGQTTMTPILLVGFSKSYNNYVSKTFQNLGFFVDTSVFPKNGFQNWKAIIIPSDIDLETDEKYNKIYEYVHDFGGGLAVFYNHSERASITMPINKLLVRFNLSFTYCLLNEDLETFENIQVPSSYTYVRDSNFIPLLAKFKAIVKQSHVETTALDDLVTTLRYYIMVCDESHNDQLIEISNYAWDFLKKSGYQVGEKIFPDIKQGIVVVLLLDLITKLQPEQVEPVPEHIFFPGKTGDVTLGDFELDINLQNSTWISTGLWLPAGVVAEVECENPLPNTHIQIGSHHESLLPKPGPWKRWPSTVTVTQLSERVNKVVTAFGGIVYVSVNNFLPTENDNKKVHIKFHNFTEYPQFKFNDPSVWERTKDIDVPWGEIDVGSVIFTLPTKDIHRITDFNIIKEKFDVISKGISDYMSYVAERPYRFVFDIELPEDCPSCGYPLVFNIEDIEGILMNFSSPTTQLFTAVTLMTIVSLREDCFEQVTETAIATIATSVIFQKLFPGFDPLEFTGIALPTSFHELWEIQCKVDPTLIPKTLAKFQDPNYQVSEVPEDMWISYVREMCKIGQRDFTKLLERSRPIPLNISISLQGLPPYP